MHVGNSVSAEVKKGRVLSLCVGSLCLLQAPEQMWERAQWAAFPLCFAVNVSAHCCLWLIIRLCHPLFFVPSPYFLYLPLPGLLCAAGGTSHCCGDCGHNKFGFSRLRLCLLLSSSYLWTKQELKEVIIIEKNVCTELTLGRALVLWVGLNYVPAPKTDMLET